MLGLMYHCTIGLLDHVALFYLLKIEGNFVKKPGLQMIAKIARVLGVPMEDL
jgi:hypothetical protein